MEEKSPVRNENNTNRVELHAHTDFSRMSSMIEPEELIQLASDLGMTSIAVTDTNDVQAFPDLQKYGKLYRLKIIYGIECTIYDDNQPGNCCVLTLLAKNRIGLKHMYKLISPPNIRLDGAESVPYISRNTLMNNRDGILIGSGHLQSIIYFEQKNKDEIADWADVCDYFELYPVNGYNSLTGQPTADTSDSARRLCNIAAKRGKPVIASSNPYVLYPEDIECLEVLSAGGHVKIPVDVGYFKSTEEMLAEYSFLGYGKAREIIIENSQKIAGMIEEYELFPQGLHLPELTDNDESELIKAVYEGANRKYGKHLPPEVHQRIQDELNCILDSGYSAIFLTGKKLIEYSESKGYHVGTRGSVGSSFVSYLIGVTNINPLPPHYYCRECGEFHTTMPGAFSLCGPDLPDLNCPVCGKKLQKDGYDIPFVTFFGDSDYRKTPDIDYNFASAIVKEIWDYTRQIFGKEKVFTAGCVGSLYGTSWKIVEKALEYKTMDADRKEWLQRKISNIKRCTGTHPGGQVIIPSGYDVYDFCPVIQLEDGTQIAGLDYYSMEDHLLKIDELGHFDQTMLHIMETISGVKITDSQLEDSEAKSLFRSTDALQIYEDPFIGNVGTLGIPDFSTNLSRALLETVKPDSFDSLVKISALCHGTGAWENNAECLLKEKTATIRDIIATRDDIFNYLVSFGISPTIAYSVMEAVRKGKVQRCGEFPENSEEVMRSAGIPDWWLESCRKISYLFPKGHAASYVKTYMHMAWYKVHQPLAFYAAFFITCCMKEHISPSVFDLSFTQIKEKLVRQTANDAEDIDSYVNSYVLSALYEYLLRGFNMSDLRSYVHKKR